MTVVVVLTLVGAACGKSSTNTSSGATGGSPTGGSPSPTVQTLKPGVLQVASCLDYKPFEYYTTGNPPQLKGFDIEITQALASKLGLQVQWIKANFDTIFTALQANKFDMVAAASTITPQREQVVNFSDTYFNAEQGFTVNTTKTPTIKSTADLKSGDTVGVQKGTTGQQWAQANLAPKGILLRTFDLAPDAFTALEAGQIVGIINDLAPSEAEVANRSGLSVVEAIDTHEHYGLAIAKSNPTLLAAINGALKAIIADGTYTKIFQKYFPGTPVPKEFQTP
jgi:polar amino acid transport system substrate-binding protein